MTRTHYYALVDRGRKAGLNTAELYQAIASRPSEVGDQNAGQADGNGFVFSYNQHGRRVYHPQMNPRGCP